MGLDMFLYARRFLWTPEREEVNKTGLISLLPEAEGLEVKGIEIEAMYWRKANAIH